MEFVENVLSSDAHWAVNKRISKEVGIESALLISFLIGKRTFYRKSNSLIYYGNESYFYATCEAIEDETTLTYRVQKTCIERLVKHGLIKTKLMSTPAKLHFCLHDDSIIELLNSSFDKNAKQELQKVNSSFDKNAKQELTEPQDINKELIIKTNNKFFIFNERTKIFQNDLKERFEYEKGNYIFFLDNSRVLDGKIIIPETFLIDFLTDIHPIRFEGILKLFEGNIEQRKMKFLSVAEKLFKERCSFTFENIDHFLHTVKKIHGDMEKSKNFKKPYAKQEKITFVKGQNNSEGW